MNLQSEITKATKLFNSGKSLPVKKSVQILIACNYVVNHDIFTGYKDTKIAGNRYVTSRKQVKFFKVEIMDSGNLIASFNSETTSHTAYSLTAFVLNNVKF